MHVRGRAAAGLMLAMAACAVVAGVATRVAAASCSAITISQGQGLDFDVSSVIVSPGACVRFANLTDVTVTVTVSGSSFSEKLPARTPASSSEAYIAHKSAVATASDGVRTGHGDITVESGSGQPTTTSTSSAYTPAPQAGSGSVPPRVSVASTIPPFALAHAPAPVGTEGAVAVLPVLPSLPNGGSSAPPTASHPVVAPRVRTSDPRFTSTVLEPASGSGRGLPAAVAIVLLLGLASAYGRTVLIAAPPVDSRRAARPLRPTV